MIKRKNGTYVVTYSTRDKFGRKIKRQKSGISSLARAKRMESELISELIQRRKGFDYADLSFIEFVDKHYLPYCYSNFSDAENLVPNDVDMVTALHACDTATDDAIFFGLKRKVKYFFFKI